MRFPTCMTLGQGQLITLLKKGDQLREMPTYKADIENEKKKKMGCLII